MSDKLKQWLLGGTAGVIIIIVGVFLFINTQKASQPEVDTSKPPASFYESYGAGAKPAN